MTGPLDLYHIRQLLERRRNDGGTHWEDCWKEHVDCALSRLVDEFEEVQDHYSDALDEVYLLRVLMEYEATVQQVNLQFKTFPKSRRVVVQDAIERMQRAARGEALEVARERTLNAGPGYRSITGSKTLTRWEWEHRKRRGPEQDPST